MLIAHNLGVIKWLKILILSHPLKISLTKICFHLAYLAFFCKLLPVVKLDYLFQKSII
jgi:hypothetical protein